MSIITISRGSFSKGKEIAEKVSKRLGYECISRDVLLDASEQFNTPEIKLVRALHDAPSVLDRFTHGKERYVAYIREAILTHFQKDNIVYHGLAGHFFLKGVEHALKVRIIADLEDRIRLEMEREKISEGAARRILKKDDDERRRWSLTLYGVDTADTSLYDLAIHIRKITVDDAVDLICQTASLPGFQTTPQSQKALDNLVLAARARALLVVAWPEAQVSAEDGEVVVHVEAPKVGESTICDQITQMVSALDGVEKTTVHVRLGNFYGAD